MTQDLCGHLLLREWAAWAGEQNVLGLPTRSTIERARQGGLERGACSPEGPMPPEIRKTDAAVSRLRLIDQMAWRALKLHYLSGYPVFRLASEMKISRRKVEFTLVRAQRLVRMEREGFANAG